MAKDNFVNMVKMSHIWSHSLAVLLQFCQYGEIVPHMVTQLSSASAILPIW